MKKKNGHIAGGVLLLFLTLTLWGQEKETLETLLEKGAFDQAETFCANQSKDKRETCFIAVGDACFKQKAYEQAARCYENAGYKYGLNKIADHYLSTDNFQKALGYYKKGGQTAGTARTYGRMADGYRDTGNPGEAKKYYNSAVLEYEKAIKTFNFAWKTEYGTDRKRCLRERNKFPKTEEENARAVKLVKILEKCAQYCRLLEQASIYFFCYEEIVQKGDYSRMKLANIMATPSESRTIFYNGRRRTITPKNVKRTYLYEYQLIKEKPEDEAQERRILVKKDGKKKRREDAQLETAYYKHEKVLFGPVGLLNTYWQRFYDYKIIGNEIIHGEKTIIIEAIPALKRGHNTLFGKVWVTDGDFSIVKIEWNPKSVQSIQSINMIAALYKETPRIVFVSEFNKERSGIRFPTRFFIEEAYVNEKGNKFVRLHTDVTYKDYQFFNVQVGEIEYEE